MAAILQFLEDDPFLLLDWPARKALRLLEMRAQQRDPPPTKDLHRAVARLGAPESVIEFVVLTNR